MFLDGSYSKECVGVGVVLIYPNKKEIQFFLQTRVWGHQQCCWIWGSDSRLGGSNKNANYWGSGIWIFRDHGETYQNNLSNKAS